MPQVERPEETNALLMDFFARAEAAERPARAAPSLRAVAAAPPGAAA